MNLWELDSPKGEGNALRSWIAEGAGDKNISIVR